MLLSAFYFSFRKVHDESHKVQREGIKTSQGAKCWFYKKHIVETYILKVNSKDSDDLSLQEPHLRREVESRYRLESPEDSWGGQPWLVPGRVGIFVLIPVLFGVMISTALISLNK